VRLLVTVILGLAAGACERDMREQSTPVPDRRVAGDFSMRRLPDGSGFTLLTPATVDSAGGAVGGPLVEIGWAEEIIMVSRLDSAGQVALFLLDATDGSVLAGPAPDIAVELPPGFEWKTAAEAWKSLE
jgi:hypothetical protein